VNRGHEGQHKQQPLAHIHLSTYPTDTDQISYDATYIKRQRMNFLLGSFLSNTTLLYNRLKLFILLSFSATHNKIKIGMSYELIFKNMYTKFSKNWEMYGKTYMIWPSSTEYIHRSQRSVSPGKCFRRAQFLLTVDKHVFGNQLLIQDKDIGKSYNCHLKQFSVQ
jgi:hypothetical protein